MADWKASAVRDQYIQYFKDNGHTFVPSSPVVPLDDPTLLFANSGMAQFKDIFVGKAPAESQLGKIKAFKKVANSQKCIRAGGKHNDLEDVGKDVYHHTFFEMLGNWSFGDYFKKEAIAWAWDLLTNVYKLNPERLYVTYFEGNKAFDIPVDEEAKALWKQYLPEERILPFGMKENFWEMGDTGPCGPCSEIHFDRIGGRDASKLVNADDPDVLEIWNLVFMQYNREEAGGRLTKLPAPCVDTGMGFERLLSVLQGVRSNYDTDLWKPIFKKLKELTGAPEYTPGSSMADVDFAYRVIADHIRTITFAIIDGATPDKDGRNFVLRRIARRAIRVGREFMNAPIGFFSELVDAVAESMGDFYTELSNKNTVERVKSIIRKEEDLFAKTWDSGKKHFQDAVSRAKDNTISGVDAFILHDRYGFPIDLTQVMAEKAKLNVDMAVFEQEMKKAKEIASNPEAMRAKKGLLTVDQTAWLESNSIGTTHDLAKYDWTDVEGKVLAIVNTTPTDESMFLDKAEGVEKGFPTAIIVDKTSYYAEAGGQIYDIGTITVTGGDFVVTETQNIAGYIVHKGHLGKGATVSKGDSVKVRPDLTRRSAVASNHTSTHILNYALRKVLILDTTEAKDKHEKVDQRGSLVDDAVLRFDYSWHSKLTEEQIANVERVINEQIKSDLQVFSKELPKEQAEQICSLRSVFGEKYPDNVRVISVGGDIEKMLADPKNEEWFNYSVEFCGGTHLKKTGEAKLAKIIQEQALGGNTRRMLLYTQGAAEKSIEEANKLEAELDAISNGKQSAAEKLTELGRWSKKTNDALIPLLLKSELNKKQNIVFAKLSTESKEFAKQAGEAGKKIAAKIKEEVASQNSKFIVRVINTYDDVLGSEREALQEATQSLEELKLPVLLVSLPADKSKPATVIAVSTESSQISAKDWIVAACGKGGGSKLRAQGGAQGPGEQVTKAANEYASKLS